ncbi:hypothetical protein [Oceanobacillus sojae]|uniref:hypothetical protein n=1 Tax=Oceanobacillus sojae TaxID=582851 RepID=UPI0015892447|nr:hypothetical protein [Oceanobacillus sojae]MCT1905364.1 hypothetical protein [Oceanobacillus sojae]
MAYSLIDSTSVQIKNLSDMKEPAVHSVKLDEDITVDWLEHFCRLNHVEEKTGLNTVI